jgi:hypothetical protein
MRTDFTDKDGLRIELKSAICGEASPDAVRVDVFIGFDR